jgi:hypothetical protein
MAITINGTGSITGLTAGGLPDGSVTAADIETSLDLTGKTVTLPSGTGGQILQVKHTRYETATSISVGASYTDLPFYVAITPSSTTSSIIVTYSVFHEWSTNGNQYNSVFSLNRFVNSTNNYLLGSGVGSRHSGLVMNYITYTAGTGSTPYGVHLVNYVDVPGVTSEVRYYPAAQLISTATMYLNRTQSDIDSTAHERGASWITAMEVEL